MLIISVQTTKFSVAVGGSVDSQYLIGAASARSHGCCQARSLIDSLSTSGACSLTAHAEDPSTFTPRNPLLACGLSRNVSMRATSSESGLVCSRLPPYCDLLVRGPVLLPGGAGIARPFDARAN